MLTIDWAAMRRKREDRAPGGCYILGSGAQTREHAVAQLNLCRAYPTSPSKPEMTDTLPWA